MSMNPHVAKEVSSLGLCSLEKKKHLCSSARERNSKQGEQALRKEARVCGLRGCFEVLAL
jgi:hypothetical protein